MVPVSCLIATLGLDPGAMAMEKDFDPPGGRLVVSPAPLFRKNPTVKAVSFVNRTEMLRTAASLAR